MAAEFTAEEIMDLTGGRLAAGMMPDEAARIVIDTRGEIEGAWFLALPGKKYDGHDFLGDAFNNGALGCIVADRPAYAIASTSFPLLAVGDCGEALTQLARNWRRRTLKKLCLVVAAGADDNLFARVCGYLRELADRSGGHSGADHGDAGGQKFLHWRKDPASIMAEFLALDDGEDFLIADFAPRSLADVPALLACLAPNAAVIPEQPFDYERLVLDEVAYAQLKATILAALSEQKRPPCLTVSLEEAVIPQDSGDEADRLRLYKALQDAGLGPQMGL
ncbi:MAG: hypothetical protein KGS72_14395 [Cyanobacteria bacterium REEB67]|nr:hypothetical protein [Cyanobacteria bacterium REEB67]